MFLIWRGTMWDDGSEYKQIVHKLPEINLVLVNRSYAIRKMKAPKSTSLLAFLFLFIWIATKDVRDYT